MYENISDSGIFICERNYWNLGTGKRKRKVAVGDGPDIRTCNILFIARIKKNHPSQWHTRFPGGYIEFDNGIKFDIAQHSIYGNTEYIFYYTDEIGDLWRIQETKKKIVEWTKYCRPQDAIAAAELIMEVIGEKFFFWSPDSAKNMMLRCLPRLVFLHGLRQLEEFADLLAPGHDPVREHDRSAA